MIDEKDDELDLNVDRGDDFTPSDDDIAADEQANADAAALRDAKGRFAKKDEDADEDAAAAAAADKADDVGKDEGDDKDGDKDDDGKENKPKAVPYSRFKEVLDRAKAAEAKVVEKPAAKKDDGAAAADARETKLTALYEEVEEARAQADTKLAASLQRQIDAINREVLTEDATAKAVSKSFAAQQAQAYDSMLDHLEQTRPALDPDSPEYDARVVKELDFQVQAYEKMGLSPTAALHRAAALLFAEDPFAKPNEKKATVTDIAHKKTDVAKNVNAAKRTPPVNDRTESRGDGKKVKVTDLSDDEFEKLPESKKRELRGDAF